MILPGIILPPDVLEAGMHGAVEDSRWASLFRDLVEAGLDMTPILGPASVALPKLSERLVKAIKALPTRNAHLQWQTGCGTMIQMMLTLMTGMTGRVQR